jgi:hypothetical protein
VYFFGQCYYCAGILHVVAGNQDECYPYQKYDNGSKIDF